MAVVLGIAFCAVALGIWVFVSFGPGSSSRTTLAASDPAPASPPAPAAPAQEPPKAAPAAAPSTSAATPPPSAPSAPSQAAAPAAQPTEPGTLVIAAQGLVDPSDPRYQGNAALMQSELRADAKSQLVEKALNLLVDRQSLAKNYDALQSKLLANSGGYIGTVVRESEPRTGKDGLVSMTTEAVVNVKAVQKSLNDMSRDERIVLIRANGNPRIAMRVAVRDADRPDAPSRPSPIAENLLKERVKAFGFRTWSEGGEPGRAGDFVVNADARIRRLSTRLEASGITVTKYAVTALTVKCIDQATGEELYFKTVMPKGTGSWATEEEALKAVGERVADEFSRDFFLQHVYVTGQRVSLVVSGLPDARAGDLVSRELVGLPSVIAARPRAGASPPAWDLVMSGSGSPGELVANGIVAPLNTKLGKACLAPGAVAGEEVRLAFEAGCSDDSILSRLETLPPAGLYSAPPSRQKSVVKNPETLRKLTI